MDGEQAGGGGGWQMGRRVDGEEGGQGGSWTGRQVDGEEGGRGGGVRRVGGEEGGRGGGGRRADGEVGEGGWTGRRVDGEAGLCRYPAPARPGALSLMTSARERRPLPEEPLRNSGFHPRPGPGPWLQDHCGPPSTSP